MDVPKEIDPATLLGKTVSAVSVIDFDTLVITFTDGTAVRLYASWCNDRTAQLSVWEESPK